MQKIVIVGAGPAGLTAGYKLLKHSSDYQVVILEESDGVGGISKTVNHHGNRMDIGGHRFFSKDSRVTDMWQEIMPLQGAPSFDDRKLNRSVELSANGPDPEKEDRVMLSRTRVSRIYYKKKFFDYPVKMNMNTICNMGAITTVTAGFSYLASVLHKLPEKSLENFYINRFGRKLYSMFFEGYTEKLWGRHPRVISADWGAQRVKGLSVLAILKDIFFKLIPGKRDNKKIETSLIDVFSYPKYGPGQLWEAVASEIERMGGQFFLNCKAKSFVKNGNKIQQVICSHDGKKETLDADILISSMPLKDFIHGLSDVPAEILKIAEGLPYRDFVTVGLLLDSLNLKNETSMKTLNNIIPDCWIYVQDVGVKLGRIQIFNNWSPYMVDDPEHNLWIGLEYFCNEDDEFWKKSPEDWVKKGVEELIRMGVIRKNAEVKDSHVEKVRKAYPAYFDTYSRIDELIRYLNSIENLYCVGRNGQHRYNNMDHSMVTAFETVKHILSGNGTPKTAIWNVNTEKEYHETKQG